MRIGTKFRGENGLDLIYMGFGTAYFPRGIKVEDRHAYILANEENNLKGFCFPNGNAFFVSKFPVRPIDVQKSLSANTNIYNPIVLLSFYSYDGFHPGVFIRNKKRSG